MWSIPIAESLFAAAAVVLFRPRPLEDDGRLGALRVDIVPAMRICLLASFLLAPLFAQEKPAIAGTADLDEKAFAALHSLKAEAAPKPTGIMVKVGDNQHYLALPKDKKGPFPAILVIHEWWGLNDHIKHWADRLAAEGYAALAVDLYGGAWSLQLAIAEPKLDACVLYYGRLVEDEAQLNQIAAPVLGVFGSRDRSIPEARLAAFEASLQKAKKDVKVLRYDAEHAFANPSSARYDQKNAAAAWVEARAFLHQHLVARPAAAAAKKSEPAGK